MRGRRRVGGRCRGCRRAQAVGCSPQVFALEHEALRVSDLCLLLLLALCFATALRFTASAFCGQARHGRISARQDRVHRGFALAKVGIELAEGAGVEL